MTEHRAYKLNRLHPIADAKASNGQSVGIAIHRVIHELAEVEGELDWSTFRLLVERDQFQPDNLMVSARIIAVVEEED